MVCFYCSRFINPKGCYVKAQILSHYKDGSRRASKRTFHKPCLQKFEDKEGRPWNPHTRCEVIGEEEIEADA